MDVKKATSILTQRIDEVALEMKELQSEDVSVSKKDKEENDMKQSASSNDNEQTEVEEEKVARSAFRR